VVYELCVCCVNGTHGAQVGTHGLEGGTGDLVDSSFGDGVRVLPIHPAFRVVALASPPTVDQQWMHPETIGMFDIVHMPTQSVEEVCFPCGVWTRVNLSYLCLTFRLDDMWTLGYAVFSTCTSCSPCSHMHPHLHCPCSPHLAKTWTMLRKLLLRKTLPPRLHCNSACGNSFGSVAAPKALHASKLLQQACPWTAWCQLNHLLMCVRGVLAPVRVALLWHLCHRGEHVPAVGFVSVVVQVLSEMHDAVMEAMMVAFLPPHARATIEKCLKKNGIVSVRCC